MTAVPRPTEAEMAILAVLWERGPSTVRDVHEAVVAHRKTGYTTVLKLMQIMVDKGLLVRDESARSHVYEAAQSRDEIQASLVADLTTRAFGGSTSSLVMRALSGARTDRKELARIRKMLDGLIKGEDA